MGIHDERYKCKNCCFTGVTQDKGEQTLQKSAGSTFLSLCFVRISYIPLSRNLLMLLNGSLTLFRHHLQVSRFLKSPVLNATSVAQVENGYFTFFVKSKRVYFHETMFL